MKHVFAILALSLSISCGAQTEVESLKVKNEITAKEYLFPDGTNLSTLTGVPGPVGPPGPQGEPGLPGASGVGVPSGGDAGQILVKATNSDYDFMWANASGGGIPGDNPSYAYRPAIIPVTASREVRSSDVNNTFACTANGTITLTEDFPAMQVGDVIYLEAHDGAQLSIQAGAGVTLNYTLQASAHYSSRPGSVLFGILRKTGVNSYIASGQ